MANDKKSEGGKPPSKVETISLKVFFHCEACKKKVKKTLNCIEGVHTVEVDAGQGKVTVTGTIEPTVLVKKLEKAGKVAELLPTAGGGGGIKAKDQQKGGIKKEDGPENGGASAGGGVDGGEGDKKGDGGGDSSNNKANNGNAGGESGKKKKGGGGGGNANGGDEIKNSANKSIAPSMIETGYMTMESAEYATHMFSDENANSCRIM